MRAALLILLIFFPMLASAQLLKTNDKCTELYRQIQAEMDVTNFCSSHKDCITPSFGCPFGCYTPLNKNADVNKMHAKNKLYRNECGRCEYRCVKEPRRLRCIRHKCVIDFEAEINPKKDEWRVYRDPERAKQR